MNRREALGALVGAAVSFVLPAPRRRIALMQFCEPPGRSRKYSLALPWECQDHVYATDGRACVRVRPESADVKQHDGKMPPFGALPWDHVRLKGWRGLPRLEPLLARDSVCPACDGSGFNGGALGTHCETCGGDGREWVGAGWVSASQIKCRGCGGRGVIPPPGGRTCPACRGNAIGTFPSIVRLGGHYFDATLYERVRRLGSDAVISPHYRTASKLVGPMLSFRFDGGEGLMLGLDRACQQRLVKGE